MWMAATSLQLVKQTEIKSLFCYLGFGSARTRIPRNNLPKLEPLTYPKLNKVQFWKRSDYSISCFDDEVGSWVGGRHFYSWWYTQPDQSTACCSLRFCWIPGSNRVMEFLSVRCVEGLDQFFCSSGFYIDDCSVPSSLSVCVVYSNPQNLDMDVHKQASSVWWTSSLVFWYPDSGTSPLVLWHSCTFLTLSFITTVRHF